MQLRSAAVSAAAAWIEDEHASPLGVHDHPKVSVNVPADAVEKPCAFSLQTLLLLGQPRSDCITPQC